MMNSITPNIIKDTVLENVQSQLTIPSPVLNTVGFLGESNLFFYYRNIKLTMYENPRDAAITGAVLHAGVRAIGFSDEVKIGLCLICAFDLLERLRLVSEAWTNLTATSKFMYPMYRKVDYDFNDNKLSPTVSIWWNTTAKNYMEQTWKVIVCVGKLGWEIFKSGWFLNLLISPDKNMEFYAYTELAENLGKYGEDFGGNMKLLVERLTSNEGLGNRLLEKAGSDKTIRDIISGIVAQDAKIFVEAKKQVRGFKEDIRGVIERGEVSMAEGGNRPSLLPEGQFIHWAGDNKIDDHFKSMPTVALPNEPEPDSESDLVELEEVLSDKPTNVGVLASAAPQAKNVLINIWYAGKKVAKTLSKPFLDEYTD